MRLAKRRLLTCLSVFALACAALLAVSPAAEADGGNCGNYNTTTDGMYSSFQTAIFGGRGKIEPMNPDLCTTPGVSSNSFSGAWTMVSAESATFPNQSQFVGYAQVGYGDFGANSPYVVQLGIPNGFHVFSFWTRKCWSTGSCGSSLNNQVKLVAKPAPSGTQIYDVHRVASDGLIHMFAGGTEVDAMNYNTTNDWSAAWDVEYMGETKQPHDNLVGTQNDPTGFFLLQKYDSGGNLNFFSGLTHSPPAAIQSSRYHFQETNPDVGGQGFRLWTDPL